MHHSAEHHALVHPERVGSAGNKRGGGEKCIPEIHLDRRHDDDEFADETAGAGQSRSWPWQTA